MSLPSGYTPLEYIKSSGTQYINTGFNPNQNTRVVVDAKPLSVTQAKTWCIFGVRTGVFFELYKASLNNMRLTFLYGSTYTQGFNSLDYTKRNTFEINKNTATVDGTTLTYSVQTFQQTYPLFLLADDNNGKADGIAAAELYSAKVYDNGTLIRDFIPCKNASGVIGLWDDVNSVFYKNAGSGTFDAGELPKAHKVCINGVGYSATKVTMLIDGTERKAKKGRVLVNGTGYDIPFSSGIPIGTLPVGSVVKIGVNGKSYDFLVVNQGIPSNSSRYDSSCNGTWLLMKDIYENRQWHSFDMNKLESSTIHSYLNSTFLNLFDSNIKDAIKQVKIPYHKNGGSGGTTQQGANGLPCKIFLLSAPEVHYEHYYIDSSEGAALSYFASCVTNNADSKRVAYLNGSAAYWWLRSPYTGGPNNAWSVNSSGGCNYDNASYSHGIRPAFILPGTFPVIQNPNGTYTPVE